MYLKTHTCLNRWLGCKPQSATYVHKIPLSNNRIFFYLSRFRLSVVSVLKWFAILITFANIIIPSQLFAQKAEGSKKAEDVIQEKQPITAYWIKNLFFTRGFNLRDEFWDLKENGAFRARWRFIYSNPLGPRFALQLEAPFGLVTPSEGKSVAGLGDVNFLFQGAVTHNKLWKQIAGLGVYLPTGSHKQLGGDLTTINPRYQIDYIGYKYVIPCFITRYYHSVIEQNGAHELRILTIDPFITIPQIAPHSVGLSASIELEWDFNFVADRSGGVMYFGLSKQMNPQTVLHVEFSPGITDYFRETAWEWRYNVDVLMTF
jgi:hypothetical protein